ncbi:MAG: phosphocholine cytidylyltransferase family protein [Nitrosarchaeum sp.]|nr:phosphocholine cytidylyltransferase family protein [Nitrosarchaeum sp.]
MKAIIIAAGSGKRLGKISENLPKSLTDVNNKSILERQVESLRRNGVLDIIVITGPNPEKFTFSHLRYTLDEDYEQHDILGSLMAAKNYISGNVLILYSDILFEDKIINTILASTHDIGVVIDLDWKKAYENRTMHPESEAENVLLSENCNILEIRKGIQNMKQIVGEFLGIVKLSSKGSEIWNKKYEELEKTHVGKFHHAPSLKKAYITDMIQELIDSKIRVEPIFISGKWCEIDTPQDLERAKSLFTD